MNVMFGIDTHRAPLGRIARFMAPEPARWAGLRNLGPLARSGLVASFLAANRRGGQWFPHLKPSCIFAHICLSGPIASPPRQNVDRGRDAVGLPAPSVRDSSAQAVGLCFCAHNLIRPERPRSPAAQAAIVVHPRYHPGHAHFTFCPLKPSSPRPNRNNLKPFHGFQVFIVST